VRGYGVLDLAFAGLWAWLGFSVAPSRSPAFSLALAVLVALHVVAGGALISGVSWARRVALLASGIALAFAAMVIVLLVASAGYLQGVYGALGRGMAVLALVAAALVVEVLALLPLFQLRFLLRTPPPR
jgi:hypothetical protein